MTDPKTIPPQDTRTATEEAFKRFPDKVEPVDYHPAGKIVQDNGGLRYAFIEGAKFGSAARNDTSSDSVAQNNRIERAAPDEGRQDVGSNPAAVAHSSAAGPASGVERLLHKIVDLVDAEDACEPLDDAIRYANEALTLIGSHSPAGIDLEELAGLLYTAAHKGLKNCHKWESPDLDAEHPTSRGYWRKVAKGMLESSDVRRRP